MVDRKGVPLQPPSPMEVFEEISRVLDGGYLGIQDWESRGLKKILRQNQERIMQSPQEVIAKFRARADELSNRTTPRTFKNLVMDILKGV